MSDREEIVERAVEWAFYCDIVSFPELVEVVGEEEAEGIQYLAETIECESPGVPEPDGELGETYRAIVESGPVPGDGRE